MTDCIDASRPRESMTARTMRRLQAKLSELVGLPPAEFAPTKKLETLISRQERRRVWTELAAVGYPLPALGLSAPVFWIASIFVLGPLLVLVFLVKTWAVVLSLPELALLVHKITRRLAIHPPMNLTVYEAALGLTPFRREDYDAGLWPAEDVAEKVRFVISISTGRAFDSIRAEDRIVDLC